MIIPTAVDANTNVSLTVSCSPTPATNFTKIRTLVTCRASDAAENVGTKDCTFNVTLACSFTLKPSDPAVAKFLVQPLRAPFRLDFDVKTHRDAIIVLAESKTEASVFAWITIGGWERGKSAIRACFEDLPECERLLGGRSEHREGGIVSGTESRPFWMEYKRGVVTVGKGGQEAAFMEWDAAAYHRRDISAPVYVGISSWKHVPAQWVFPQFCA